MVKIRPEDRLEQLKIFINSIYGNRERNPFQDLELLEAIRKEGIEDPLDIRDLYFRSDGNLAIWKIDGLKCEL